MKKFYTVAALLFASLTAKAQNVGIGTATPNPSAKLEIVDGNRGILLPRVALTATNVAAPVATPANWLVVFNTATAGAGATAVSPGLYYWDGAQWVRILSGVTSSDWTILGNAGTNATNNFIGTTDAIDFVARTNNTERMRILAGSGVQITSTNFNSNALSPALDIQGAWIRLGDALGNNTFTNGMGIKFNDNGVQHASMIFYSTPGRIDFGSSSANGNSLLLNTPTTPSLSINTTSPRIGVGTDTPLEAMHVIGNVRASSLAGVGNRMVASDANGTLTNIAAGANGQVLTMVAGAPAWAATTADWTLLGNAGTNAATNFIGTTDAVDFVTRTNNTERTRITSAGNMGLGTNNPLARLHVAGGAIRPEQGNIAAAGIHWGTDIFGGGGDEPYLRYFAEAGENTKLLIANQNDADDDITMEAGFLLFRTGDGGGTFADADRMIITTGGNVGINTITPAERFHVVGNVRTSSLAGVGNRIVSSDANGTLTNVAAGANGQVLTMVAGNPSWAAPAATDWTLTGNAGTTAATNFVGTTDAVDFVTRTNNTERTRITSAGNMGIGTNNPLARLHVAGGAIRPEVGNIAAAGINWGTDVFGGGGDEPYLRYFTEAGENTKLLIANQNDADDDITMEAGFLSFRTGDGGTTAADADRMIITTAGNVGVNTNTPNTIFQVNAGTNTANLNPAAISINRAATNVEGSIWFMTGGAARWILQQDNDNTENLQLWSTATGSFIQTWNHTTGNVGIRNTAPLYPLDVNGTISSRDVTGAGGQNILIGDDAFLSDVDAAHRTAIISTSNTAIGELQLGFSGTNPVLSGTAGFLNINQPVQIQNTANRYYRALTPQGFADQFDGTNAGVFMSNNENEEGGFWANGNYNAIISPGDNDLVKFIDEDFFNNAGSVFDNNAMRARIDAGGQYFQISDAKTKQNIVPISNSLQKIMAISGYTYQFKLAPDEVKKGQKPLQAAGVMAQEVEKVLPEAVSNHNGDYMVNYAAFAPLFIEAFKEQQQQIELLKQQNTILEQRLKSLEEKK